MEHEITERYFISNKTYAIITNEGKYIIKSKGGGVNSKSLDFNKFKLLYSGDIVKGIQELSHISSSFICFF